MEVIQGNNEKTVGETPCVTELRDEATGHLHRTWTCPECGYQVKFTRDDTLTGYDAYFEWQREWALFMRPWRDHLMKHTLDDVRAGRVRIEDRGEGRIEYVPVEAEP